MLFMEVMVPTALEIECGACGNNFWYSGEKSNPERLECPKCHEMVLIPDNS